MAQVKLDKLLSQLQTSGLAAKDQPLFQIISELIKYLRQLITEVGGISSTVTVISGTVASGGMDREWSVLTNGDVVNPEIIFADGDVIMTSIP